MAGPAKRRRRRHNKRTNTDTSDKDKASNIDNLTQQNQHLYLNREKQRQTQQLTKQPVLPLSRFPKEILEIILQHVLTHPTPIPVNPLFFRQNASWAPALDYRVLHASKALYFTGLRYYYSLNTFSISLEMFKEFPRTLMPDRWPMKCGLAVASACVRRVHVTARRGGCWAHAVRLLRGFKRLEKVVFDGRMDLRMDERNDGGFGRFAWVEMPASEGLCEALSEAAGISVGLGGIWIGDHDEASAALMDTIITRDIRAAVQS